MSEPVEDQPVASRPRIGRRGLLGGLAGAGVAVGAAAALGGAAVAAGSSQAATGTPVDTSEDPAESFPFQGAHQQGVLTPLQRASAFIAFDVTATDRTALTELFRTLTTTIRFLTGGGLPPDQGLMAPSVDSGVLGAQVPPDGLTVTVSVGASLFDDRYGLAALKPAKLRQMDAFPNDALRREVCDGDLLLQVCAHNADTVLHALRYLSRVTAGAMSPRWRQDGFTSPPRPTGTPRNLLGFKDGTANLDTGDTGLMDQLVWTHGGRNGEPAWTEGGSYHVVRLIRMLVEFWDRVNLREQENMIGRRKETGAPLTGDQEFDTPDFVADPTGDVIPVNAHIRLANPRLATADDSRILRRPYNYDAGLDPNGEYDMGLIFAAFNQDLDRQFVAVQKRLIDEPLVDYISPFGGGYFFALPGARNAADWLGRGLLGA